MYLAILGRQPELSMAEIESVFKNVAWFSDISARFDDGDTNNNIAPVPDVQRLGGSQKLAKIDLEIPSTNWPNVSKKIGDFYSEKLSERDSKLTLGISIYGFDVNPRDVQKTGLIIKNSLKNSGVSVRLIPNQTIALSTATSHHNKLGISANKLEIIIVKGKDSTLVCSSLGAQNITSLSLRDRGRPRRDAFVGMLPPKLAQIMINLSGLPLGRNNQLSLNQSVANASPRILDPFCGTGVILQEASLLGFSVYGTDINEKMVRYSRDNLNWLEDKYHPSHCDWYLGVDDATTATWQKPIDAVISESYLGQPFSATPSPAKLNEVKQNCNNIISKFLKNISPQLSPGTPMILAIPAWQVSNGQLSHLPITKSFEDYGFTRIKLKNVDSSALAYYRPDQVVARELLLLIKK